MDITEQVPELIQVIESGNLTRLKELLELGADPNSEFEGVLPLQRTVLQIPNNKEMTSLLIEYGANVHAQDEHEYSIFHNALAGHGYKRKCTRGVSAPLELVMLLLKHKINVNHIPYNSHTVLDCAVSCMKDKKITLALLDAGACTFVYRKDHPFVAAADRFDISVIKRMLACGATLESTNENTVYVRRTALIAAAAWGKLKTVQLLLKQGASVHATTDDQNTALHKASYEGNDAIMQLLLQAGAECNKQNDYGDTPLMELLSNTNLSQDICKVGSKLLIAYGADYKQLRNNKHQTAYEIARLRGIDLDKLIQQ